MELRARTRRKHAEKAQQLIPEAVIRSYAVGTGGPNPTFIHLGLAALFVVTLVIVLVTKVGIVPGALVLLVIKNAVCPPKAVVANDFGLAVLGRSFLDSKPNKVEARVAHTDIAVVERSGSRVRARFGPELVWMHKSELEELSRGIGPVPPAATPAPGAAAWPTPFG